MTADSPTERPSGRAPAIPQAAADREPPPLPPPPGIDEDFDDFDHDFDDYEPSWWSTIRPPATARATNPKPHDLEVVLDGRRRRPRTAHDEIGATAHVLRVRARLLPDEQRRFDELMSGESAIDILTMLVNRNVDDAVDKLRRRLEDEPTGERAQRTLASQIAAVSALLSAEERSTALARLASLWPEEQQVLQARLLELSPAEAAVLIRTYLARP